MTQNVITMGGYQPPTSVHNRAGEVLGEALHRGSGTDRRFELDGNLVASRGIKAADLPVMVESGDLTLCYFASSYLAHRVPELSVFDVPFLIDDRERAYEALDGALGERISQSFLRHTGLRVLAFWDNGFRHFSNRVHPIHTPGDCRGLRIRSMDSALHQAFFRLLDFVPTFVDVRDLVEAARTGTVDAQENPLTNTYNFGTHHHHRHITLSGHLFGIVLLLCNAAEYEAWPMEFKEVLHDAVAEATAAQRRMAAAEDAAILAKLDPAENEVVTLTEAERGQFVEAVAPLLEEQRTVLGKDLFAQLEA